jgi:hypothetical protein
VDDPRVGGSRSSAPDRQDNVRRLTDSDPIIIADIGARCEVLPMKQLRMRETNEPTRVPFIALKLLS